MARTIKFEGRSISVPDDATDAEVSSIIEQSAPKPAPAKPADFSKVQPETFTDKAALAADKVLKSVGSALPDWLPSRQDVVNTAAGASTVGGLLENAPRIQNVADKDSTAYTVGKVLDPTMWVGGGKAYQAATQLPQVARIGRTLHAETQLPQVTRLGRTLQTSIGGAAAGGATSVPTAVRQTLEGDVGDAAGTLAGGTAMGAAVVPALSGAAHLASRGAAGLQNMLAGAGGRATTELRNIFGDRADDVVAALDSLRGIVPGEAPTAGKAASASFPELKVLEEAAKSRPGAHRFLEREAQNEAARAAPIERIAEFGRAGPAAQGGRIPLSPAEASRRNVTRPMYEAAGQQELNVTPQLSELLRGSQIQGALGRADTSMQQAITNALVGGHTPPSVGTAGRTVRGVDLPEWSMAPRTPDVVTPPRLSVDVLQRLKGQLDSDVAKTVDPLAKSQLETARNQLNVIMRSGSPEYSGAQDMFRTMSQPQNQADVAQVLVNALRTPGGAEREASFLQAVRNAPGTVKKSGVPRFETMEQVFSPTQMREVGDITRSLRREAEYSGLKANRGMVPEFMSPLEQMERQIPTVFSQGVTALRSALRNIGGRSDANVQRVIDEAMLDPRRMADLIDSVPPEARNQAMNSMRAAFNNPEILGGMVGTAVAQ